MARGRAHAGLGVALLPDAVRVAAVRRCTGGWEVARLSERTLPGPVLTGEPTAAHAEWIGEALSDACAEAGRAPVVQLSLPTPVAGARLLRFRQLPRSPRLRAELVRWRMAQELRVSADTLACTDQPAGYDGDEPLTLAVAMPRAWRDTVLAGALRAGLLVSALDLDTAHSFNALPVAHALAGQGGVLLLVRESHWALMAWNPAGHPRLVRSRWREARAATPPGEIAADAEQTLRAYGRSPAGREGFRILVAGTEAEAGAVAGHLDVRLREPAAVVPITAFVGPAATDSPNDLDRYAAALAAAIPR